MHLPLDDEVTHDDNYDLVQDIEGQNGEWLKGLSLSYVYSLAIVGGSKRIYIWGVAVVADIPMVVQGGDLINTCSNIFVGRS